MRSERVPKQEYVEGIFSSIAPRYDLLNSILSLNLHQRWRRFAARQCRLSPGDSALDVGAGTMDLALDLSRRVGSTGTVVGIDFCEAMLEIGKAKLVTRGVGNVMLIRGDAERLPLRSCSFHSAAIGFVLRNVTSVEAALAEMVRVVRPGGRVVVLEFTRPTTPVLGPVCSAYTHRVLPAIGGLVSGNRQAYDYLASSVDGFLSTEELARLMEKMGLDGITVHRLAGGVVAVHSGTKQ